MKQLTQLQKEFIIQAFFSKCDSKKHPGWYDVASKLLEMGYCIVALNYCIWTGYIGNFIKVTPTPDAIGCSTYKFDLDSFMKSKMFKTHLKDYLDDLFNKKAQIEKEYDEIQKLA